MHLISGIKTVLLFQVLQQAFIICLQAIEQVIIMYGLPMPIPALFPNRFQLVSIAWLAWSCQKILLSASMILRFWLHLYMGLLIHSMAREVLLLRQIRAAFTISRQLMQMVVPKHSVLLFLLKIAQTVISWYPTHLPPMVMVRTMCSEFRQQWKWM